MVDKLKSAHRPDIIPRWKQMNARPK